MITLQAFKTLAPLCKNPQDTVNALNKYMPLYGIDTVNRVRMFIAEALCESQGFTHFSENLMYTHSDVLYNTFKKHFTGIAEAQQYVGNPQKIANKVYENRMGNGPASSGDGWLFHGRGIFQLTGKEEYAKLNADIPSLGVMSNPDVLLSVEGAVISACWFWKNNNLNRFADTQNIDGCSLVINGGTNGRVEREQNYTKTRTVIM